MRRALFCFLLVCLPVAGQVAPVPTSTQLTSNPFAIKKSWPIGGTGSWDYLTMDPQASRLYIAHGRSVQVVDVDSGSMVGEIPGFREAHQVALDDTGAYGYVSDGLADAVAVFDRRTFEVESRVPINCSPRSIAFEPQSKLVFAVCGAVTPPPQPQHPARPGEKPAPSSGLPPALTPPGISHVIAIDAEKNSVVADLMLPGDFRFAQADGGGSVYVSVGAAGQTITEYGMSHLRSWPPRIARFDAASIAAEARRQVGHQPDQAPVGPAHWDLNENSDLYGSLVHFLPLKDACSNPQGLAIDGRHQRLFLACNNQQFIVLDSNDGHVVASLTTGPGDDVLAYDPDHELIFVANGGGYGSLTIVQQDANTDSYAVVQNLPTMEHARTVAVDSSSGEVYLITDLHGVDLTKLGGIGTLRFDPIAGSFQVLVVGH